MPAATLFLPVFRVDLEDTEGPNTFFTVNNASASPVVARVALWTDWGLNSLSFNLPLGSGGAEVINLRDLFASGHGFPGQVLDPESRTRLVAWHMGQTDPVTGLCYGGPATNGYVTGFVTIDAVQPDRADVLWGDAFQQSFRDERNDGDVLLHLPVEPPAKAPATFYSWLGQSDQRAPLGRVYESRYLVEFPMLELRDFTVWVSPGRPVAAEGVRCGSVPAWFTPTRRLRVMFLDDDDGQCLAVFSISSMLVPVEVPRSGPGRVQFSIDDNSADGLYPQLYPFPWPRIGGGLDVGFPLFLIEPRCP